LAAALSQPSHVGVALNWGLYAKDIDRTFAVAELSREGKMDQNSRHVLNDLTDAVEKLTEIVRELNPGATNQLGFIDFVLARASRVLEEQEGS